MQPTTSKTIYLLFGIIILLLLLILGSAVFLLSSQGKLSVFGGNKVGNFFDMQNASSEGKITKVSGELITIENLRKESMTFRVSKSLTITDPGGNSTGAASGPVDPTLNKTPQVGKRAFINYQFVGGEYQISSISYLPDSVAPAAVPTPNASGPVVTPPKISASEAAALKKDPNQK